MRIRDVRVGGGSVSAARSVRRSAVRAVAILPLAELEPLPRTGTSRLLALNRPGVPGHKTCGPELGPVLAIGFHQRPGNGVPQRAGLTGLTATVHVGLHIERAQRIRRGEGLLDVLHQRRPGE